MVRPFTEGAAQGIYANPTPRETDRHELDFSFDICPPFDASSDVFSDVDCSDDVAESSQETEDEGDLWSNDKIGEGVPLYNFSFQDQPASSADFFDSLLELEEDMPTSQDSSLSSLSSQSDYLIDVCHNLLLLAICTDLS